MERCFPQVVFEVAIVDVKNFGGHGGPEAVDFDVAIAPVFADAGGPQPCQFQALGVSHVQAGAAPKHVARFAVPLYKPLLLVGEVGIVVRAGERHEPESRHETLSTNVVGHGLHAARIPSLGVVAHENLALADSIGRLFAILPAAVDLYDAEAKRFQVCSGEVGLRPKLLLVRGAHVVPGAVDHRLRP